MCCLLAEASSKLSVHWNRCSSFGHYETKGDEIVLQVEDYSHCPDVVLLCLLFPVTIFAENYWTGCTSAEHGWEKSMLFLFFLECAKLLRNHHLVLQLIVNDVVPFQFRLLSRFVLFHNGF